MVRVSCYWCDKDIKRSPSALSRVNHVFCGRKCKQRFEEVKHEAIAVDGDDKDRLSRQLISDLERHKEGYGDV